VEFQLHPASPRGAVRRFAWYARGERIATAAAGLAAALAVSLWVTVPTLARRALRGQSQAAIHAELAGNRRTRSDLEARAAGVRDRALDAGDRINRIAFLYRVPPARWPRSLNPETGVLAGSDPARLARGCDRYLIALERGQSLLEAAENEDPDLSARTPSRLPLRSDLVEPSALFGPRVSPWTASEEFFPGIDLAAPEGSGVIAPSAGTVVFVGGAKATPTSRLARFGKLVILRHGSAGVTLYGHLGRVDVRRGERVRRGQPLGTVGSTGWAVSPGLHYEYWVESDGRLSATDPLFAILDRRLGKPDATLERMRRTSAPSSITSPPLR
jgi:murein DD-endopeptidase MepM/ murein hydrolase activator NlpD